MCLTRHLHYHNRAGMKTEYCNWRLLKLHTDKIMYNQPSHDQPCAQRTLSGIPDTVRAGQVKIRYTKYSAEHRVTGNPDGFVRVNPICTNKLRCNEHFERTKTGRHSTGSWPDLPVQKPFALRKVRYIADWYSKLHLYICINTCAQSAWCSVPCPMCLPVKFFSKINRVIFGIFDPINTFFSNKNK